MNRKNRLPVNIVGESKKSIVGKLKKSIVGESKKSIVPEAKKSIDGEAKTSIFGEAQKLIFFVCVCCRNRFPILMLAELEKSEYKIVRQWRRKLFLGKGLTFREANSVGVSSQPSMGVWGMLPTGNF